MTSDATIVFGAIVHKLDDQLRGQGLWVTDEEELRRIQLIADAVSVVTIHGLMPHSQSDRARDKLAKRLWKIVRPDGVKTTQANDSTGSSHAPADQSNGLTKNPFLLKGKE